MPLAPIDPLWTRYRRTQVAEMRPVEDGEILPSFVSVSEADRKAGSPKSGDMIARNPANHNDQWLVAADYFAANFQSLRLEPRPLSEADFPL